MNQNQNQNKLEPLQQWIESIKKASEGFEIASKNYIEHIKKTSLDIDLMLKSMSLTNSIDSEKLNLIPEQTNIDFIIKKVGEEQFNNSTYEIYSYKFNGKKGIFYIRSHFHILKLFTSLGELMESYRSISVNFICKDGIDISSLQEGEELEWNKLKTLLISVIK